MRTEYHLIVHLLQLFYSAKVGFEGKLSLESRLVPKKSSSSNVGCSTTKRWQLLKRGGRLNRPVLDD